MRAPAAPAPSTLEAERSLLPGRALLRFARENRAYFAQIGPDRSDAYFAGFAARHSQLPAEQAAGLHHARELTADG